MMRRGDIISKDGIEGIALSNVEIMTVVEDYGSPIVVLKGMIAGYELNASPNCRLNTDPALTARRAEKMEGYILPPGSTSQDFVGGCCINRYGVLPLGKVQMWMEDMMTFLSTWYFN